MKTNFSSFSSTKKIKKYSDRFFFIFGNEIWCDASMQTQEIIMQTDLQPLSVVAIASCWAQQNAIVSPRCHSHLQWCYEWCQVHPSHPASEWGDTPLSCPQEKVPTIATHIPVALPEQRASQAAPSPVLFCHSGAFVPCGSEGGPCCLLALSVVYCSSCCSCLPLEFFHRLSHHHCSWALLHLQHLESWSESYCLGQFLVFSFIVLILQIINLN